MKKGYFIIGPLILFAATLLSYYYVPFDNWQGCLINHSIYHAAPLFAIFCGLLAIRRYGWNTYRGKNLIYLTGAVTAWFLGDLISHILQYGYDRDVFPSFIDIIYLLGYPLLFISLFREMKIVKIVWTRDKIARVIIFSLLLTVSAAYSTIYLAYNSANDALTNIVNLLYGLVDVALAIVAIIALISSQEYKGGKFASVYSSFFLAIFLSLLGDMLYGAFVEQYDEGVLLFKFIDLFYIASYLAFAYGFFSLDFYTLEAQKRIKEHA